METLCKDGIIQHVETLAKQKKGSFLRHLHTKCVSRLLALQNTHLKSPIFASARIENIPALIGFHTAFLCTERKWLWHLPWSFNKGPCVKHPTFASEIHHLIRHILWIPGLFWNGWPYTFLLFWREALLLGNMWCRLLCMNAEWLYQFFYILFFCIIFFIHSD